MRIIAGEYRHRRFNAPKTFNARPTTDFAKESLFNILTNRYTDCEGITAADLFSGTGSITFELLSRGAAAVVAVEKCREHADFIRNVAGKLSCLDRLRLRSADVFRFIQTSGMHFDLIFADPPYDLPGLGDLPILLLRSGMLNSGGVLIVEHSAAYSFSEIPGFTEHRAYGSVNFSFFSPDGES